MPSFPAFPSRLVPSSSISHSPHATEPDGLVVIYFNWYVKYSYDLLFSECRDTLGGIPAS